MCRPMYTVLYGSFWTLLFGRALIEFNVCWNWMGVEGECLWPGAGAGVGKGGGWVEEGAWHVFCYIQKWKFWCGKWSMTNFYDFWSRLWGGVEGVRVSTCLLMFCFMGVPGIFFLRGKVIFPDFFPGVKCFFPVENFHFVRPKTNFSGFEK